MNAIRACLLPGESAARRPPAAPGAAQPPRRACGGLFSKRERWGLSLRGALLAGALVAGTGLAWLLGIHPFLAVTAREPAQLLVVEGWIHDHAIAAAGEEFRSGRYPTIVATGGPVHGVGAYRNDFSTSASIGAQRLRAAGVPADRVQMVPARIAARDRTYAAALALRAWLREHGASVRRINVVTEDLHARRTRLLFQEALGDRVAVGVIAVPNPDYDSARWWRYSQGVREVLGETIAYLYAKFLFFPPPASTGERDLPQPHRPT